MNTDTNRLANDAGVALAEKMFASAASVITHLVEKEAKASDCESRLTEQSIRLDAGWVVAIAEIPAGSMKFLIRFDSEAISHMVRDMMGGQGEMGAAGSSVISEIVSQIASTMTEELATSLKMGTTGITAVVCDDAKRLPPPVLKTYEATLSITGGESIAAAIDFDRATAKLLGVTDMSPASGGVMPGASPAVAEVPSASTTQKPSKNAPQPIAYTPMSPDIDQLKSGRPLDFVHDVPMQVKALLGRTALTLRDVVNMQPGSVFELDKSSSDPVDLYVNNILVARGEVVVVEDRYAVKIRELNPRSNQGR